MEVRLCAMANGGASSFPNVVVDGTDVSCHPPWGSTIYDYGQSRLGAGHKITDVVSVTATQYSYWVDGEKWKEVGQGNADFPIWTPENIQRVTSSSSIVLVDNVTFLKTAEAHVRINPVNKGRFFYNTWYTSRDGGIIDTLVTWINDRNKPIQLLLEIILHKKN